MKTIDRTQAVELYALLDRHDHIAPDAPLDPAFGFTVLGSQLFEPANAVYPSLSHYYLVLRDSDGATWGLPYSIPPDQTEIGEFPWTWIGEGEPPTTMRLRPLVERDGQWVWDRPAAVPAGK